MDGGRVSVGSEVGVGVVAHILRNTLHCFILSLNPGTSQVVPWDFLSRFKSSNKYIIISYCVPRVGGCVFQVWRKYLEWNCQCV